LGKKLVVVESPTKAKTIGKYLGKDYVVKASMGHIKDLPKSEMGVEIENGFLPDYRVIPGKEKVVAELKKAAGKTDSVFLATDPDREGEAISYHVKEEIDPVNSRIKRVLFYEITERGVKEAFSSAGEVDMDRVRAQWARRVLDRLVGYLISPLLWKKVKWGLSAGRVQSVALRLICEREEERDAFVPEEYWIIEATLEKDQNQFTAKLSRKKGKKVKIGNEQEARKAEETIKNSTLKIVKIERKTKQRKAPPPLITSSLQQEAYRAFKFPVKKTMQIAQRLYEGVDLGEGPVGLITYMRTDSYRISPLAIKDVRKLIKEKFGEDYLPARENRFKSRETAQEAHEAIRPTYVNLTPESLRGKLSPDEYKIYSIIWKRFVASQMKPYVYEETKVAVAAGDYTLEAEGKRTVFPGYRKVTGESVRDNELPALSEGDVVNLVELKLERKETQPPPRYTEASLVKELEEKGIGRPSTYASIISTLQDRTYVYKEDGKFIPTVLGQIVVKLLKESFPDIMDYKYTAEIEAELDKVERGEKSWQDVVSHFYSILNKYMEQASDKMPAVTQGIRTGLKCPACGGELLLKRSRFGLYFQCSSCEYKAQFSQLIKKAISMKCPKCGAPLTVKKGRNGEFIACTRYPECKYIYQGDEEDLPCPKGCGGHLVRRRGRGGRYFYGCSSYPDCKFITNYKPVRTKCPECGFDYMLKKGKKLICPNCDYEMKYEEG